MNSTITTRKTPFFTVSAILTGTTLVGIAFILGFRLVLPLGAMLIGIGLLYFPALLVAVMFGGYYLYFLTLERFGIYPYTNLTATYFACQNGLTLLSLLFYRYQTGNPPKMLNSNTGMFAIFVGYILAQYFLFSNTPGATQKLGFLVIQAIPAFLVGNLLDRRVAIRSFKIAFVFTFFLGVYTLFKAPWNLGGIRFTPIAGWGPHTHPYVLSAGAILIICFYFFQPTSPQRLLTLLVLISYQVVFFLNCILAASRGPVLSFIVAGIGMIIYFGRERMLKIQHTFIIILVIVLLIFTWGKVSDVFQGNMVRIKQTVNLSGLVFGNLEEVESVSPARIGYIKEEFSSFAKNPIFGFGFGNAMVSFSYVHNAFLEVLFETGFIGALLFIGIIYKIGEQIFRIGKKSGRVLNTQDRLIVILTFLWLYFIMALMFSGSIFSSLHFWFLTGAILKKI